MKLKFYIPLPRMAETQSFHVNLYGHVSRTRVPGVEAMSEPAFFRYHEYVEVPPFRIELERFCMVNISPTKAVFYIAAGETYEPFTVSHHALTVPVFVTLKDDERKPHCAVITDTGMVVLVFEEMSTAMLMHFQSTAGDLKGITGYKTETYRCVAHIRDAQYLSPQERILPIAVVEETEPAEAQP